MGDVVDEHLADLVADERPLVDVVLVHRQQLLLVGHAQDERQAGPVADPEDLVLRDREDDVGEGVVAEAGDAAVVDLIADDVLVAGFLDLHEIDHAVVESHQQLLGGLVEVDAQRLLGVSLGPQFDEF